MCYCLCMHACGCMCVITVAGIGLGSFVCQLHALPQSHDYLFILWLWVQRPIACVHPFFVAVQCVVFHFSTDFGVSVKFDSVVAQKGTLSHFSDEEWLCGEVSPLHVRADGHALEDGRQNRSLHSRGRERDSPWRGCLWQGVHAENGGWVVCVLPLVPCWPPSVVGCHLLNCSDSAVSDIRVHSLQQRQKCWQPKGLLHARHHPK